MDQFHLGQVSDLLEKLDRQSGEEAANRGILATAGISSAASPDQEVLAEGLHVEDFQQTRIFTEPVRTTEELRAVDPEDLLPSPYEQEMIHRVKDFCQMVDIKDLHGDQKHDATMKQMAREFLKSSEASDKRNLFSNQVKEALKTALQARTDEGGGWRGGCCLGAVGSWSRKRSARASPCLPVAAIYRGS